MSMLKKDYVLGMLFFSALWGVSEAGLGGLMYSAGVPHASIFLTLVAFGILSVSRSYLPQVGTATLIGLFAMLFKFLNSPFWACHFAGIAITGVTFDVVFLVAKRFEGDVKIEALAGLLGAFGSYAVFAVAMRYVIHYEYWVGPMDKFWGHMLNGAMAAGGCAVVTPLMLRAGEKLRGRFELPFRLRPNTVSFATAGLWALSLAVFSVTVIAG